MVLPELYDYAKVPINQLKESENLRNVTKRDKASEDGIRHFWAGGLLNNTPFRELLKAHENYWAIVEAADRRIT